MDKPTLPNQHFKKTDLVLHLLAAGESFLKECRGSNYSSRDRSQDDKFQFYNLITDQHDKYVDQVIVRDLEPVDVLEHHHNWMHKPIFLWNGSVKDPVISNANNILINTSECFPPSLLSLAMDYGMQGYGFGQTIYDCFVKKIGALFLCAANPRDFQIDASRGGIELAFKNPLQPNIQSSDYIVSDKIFFGHIAKLQFFAFDVHDIVHHISQLKIYGDFYQRLAGYATEEILDNPIYLRQKLLLRLLLLTTLEHAVVTSSEGFQSFGCLNRQSPRKSVLSLNVSNKSEYHLHEYPFGANTINQWSTIRALASIYRRQIEAEDVLNITLDRMSAMGYNIDHELLTIVKPFQQYDYSDYYIDTAYKANIVAPSSPEELFANCKTLLLREFS